ncbi:MAG: GIY-YIG nuclease family protein [Chloroflexi bacterium]|nr:GIY-YIG nuclease family protein [Chloroflexota bacterium]
MKGSYILLVKVLTSQSLDVGSLGSVHLPGRYYAYLGSAMGGFKSRLNRHLREEKDPKWHIDYLLQIAPVNSIIICEAGKKVECTIAQALATRFEAVPAFGSSDCDCPSHLFYDDTNMEQPILRILRWLNLKPKLLDDLGRVKEYY